MTRRSNVSRNVSASENMFAWCFHNCPGCSESEKSALCEWFILKRLDPPLLVGIYFITPEQYNTYMIHGMRGCQKVAKSANEIHIQVPQKYLCMYIYIYVSRPCALCPLLIHILLICEDTHLRGSFARTPWSWTHLRYPWHQALLLAEWVLLVRFHLPGLPLIHQTERLAHRVSIHWAVLSIEILLSTGIMGKMVPFFPADLTVFAT